MTRTTLTSLPKGYRVLPFEAPRFAEQDAVNADAHQHGPDLDAIKAVAAGQVAEFPQYDGKFDGDDWVLVRCVEDVVGKGGLRFAKGDYTIADTSRPVWPFASVGAPTWSVWSIRGAVSCEVYRASFEVVR